MIKIKVLCALSALSIAPLALAAELSEDGDFLEGVAAIVNEGIVLKGQYHRQLASILKRAETQGMQLPPEEMLREQVIERLILDEIQLQRARRMGIEEQISDRVVNDAIGRVAAAQNIAFEDMPEFIERTEGISYAEFRVQVRQEIMLNELKTIEVMRRIRVSEREIAQCILDLETNVVVNSDWNLSHILLPIKEAASAQEIAEVEALSEDIVSRLDDSADFRELAARYSGGATALEGGSLGWMPGQQIPSIFTDVLQDMQAGDVSAPFRTANSIHIVKVDDLRSAVERSEINQAKIRHILIAPNEIIDDATAKQQLTDALKTIREGGDFGEQAKLLSDDPGSANLGGDLGWSVTSDFAPQFEEKANVAEVGVITEPFQTQFGWHILEVLERRVYDNTEELKERNCVVRIRGSKQEEETLLWLQRLRDEAFVDVRI